MPGSVPGLEQGLNHWAITVGRQGLLKSIPYPSCWRNSPVHRTVVPGDGMWFWVWLLLEEQLEGPLTVVKELYR